MKRSLTHIFVLICSFVTAASSQGQITLSLQQCIDSALLKNGMITAAELEIKKAGILKGTAFDPPKTEIVLKQETTGGGGPENGVQFSQDFEFPTVYVERSKVLAARENIERSNYNITVNNLKYEVAAQYHTLLYQRELLDLNQATAEMYERFQKLAETRFNDGDCSALEKMNAVRMMEKNRQERIALLQDYATATNKMKLLTGCYESVEPSTGLFEPLIQVVDSAGFTYDTTPEAILADSEIALSRRNVVLAKHELLPDLYLSATVQALIKSFNPYNVDRSRFEQGNFMGFEVGISVPLFFGAQKSRIKAAETEANIALLNKETAAIEAESRFKAILSELGKAESQLNYYTGTALKQADEIKRLAEVSYEYGEIDYMEYIGNLETYYSIRKEYAAAVNDYNQTILRLNHLTGQQ